MNIQEEKEAFLNVFQFFKSFKGIGFSEETEQFFLKKNKPNDAECLDVSNLNQMWRAWWARAKAQAVPDTYTPVVLALEDVQSKIAQASFLTMDADNENEVYAVDANELAKHISDLIEAQEQGHETSF